MNVFYSFCCVLILFCSLLLCSTSCSILAWYWCTANFHCSCWALVRQVLEVNVCPSLTASSVFFVCLVSQFSTIATWKNKIRNLNRTLGPSCPKTLQVLFFLPQKEGLCQKLRKELQTVWMIRLMMNLLLPEDIVTEILVRLPVKTLLRFFKYVLLVVYIHQLSMVEENCIWQKLIEKFKGNDSCKHQLK